MTDETVTPTLSLDESAAILTPIDSEPVAPILDTPVDPEPSAPVFDAPAETTPEPVDIAPVIVTPDAVIDPAALPVSPLSEIELLEADFIKKIREAESFTADSLREAFHWVKAELEKI